jgi:hypothetical protein
MLRRALIMLLTALCLPWCLGAQAADAPKSYFTLVLPALQQQYGSWGYFDYFAQHNIEQTDAELAGTKKRPVP